MAKAASKAALALIRDYNEADNLVSSMAGAAQFVEASRRRSGETIRRELAHARPDFSFDSPAEGSRWIVSALDGVGNLVHAIPHTSVAVAVEMTGEIVAGVVLDPLRDELFWAERGHGAFMRSRRLRVSGTRSLSGSVLAHGDGRAECPRHRPASETGSPAALPWRSVTRSCLAGSRQARRLLGRTAWTRTVWRPAPS